MSNQMQKNSKQVSVKKSVSLKLLPLESKVTPCCTFNECKESGGWGWNSYNGQCNDPQSDMFGKLAVVADY